MTLHKYIIIRSDCTELTAPDLCLRDWSDQYLHFFRLGYELSYGWLEAPQAHVSSMRASRLLYLSSPDVEEGVHFSLRQTLLDTLDTCYEVITMTPNTYSVLTDIHFVS